MGSDPQIEADPPSGESTPAELFTVMDAIRFLPTLPLLENRKWGQISEAAARRIFAQWMVNEKWNEEKAYQRWLYGGISIRRACQG